MPSFQDLTFREFLDQTSAKTPTPGGGAVASAVGALAGALGQMVVNYSLGKKNLADHQPALQASIGYLERCRALFLALADEDAQAYGLVNELFKLPENDPRRIAELPAASRAAVNVPMSAAAVSVELLRHCRSLAPITNRYLRSDLAIAAVLAEATARAARWNVFVNIPGLPDETAKAEANLRIAALLEESTKLCREVEAACV